MPSASPLITREGLLPLAPTNPGGPSASWRRPRAPTKPGGRVSPSGDLLRSNAASRSRRCIRPTSCVLSPCEEASTLPYYLHHTHVLAKFLTLFAANPLPSRAGGILLVLLFVRFSDTIYRLSRERGKLLIYWKCVTRQWRHGL